MAAPNLPSEGFSPDELCNWMRSWIQDAERIMKLYSGYGEPLSDSRPGRPTEEKEIPDKLAKGPFFHPEEMAKTAAMELSFLGSKLDFEELPDVLINRGTHRAFHLMPPYEIPKVPDDPQMPMPASMLTADLPTQMPETEQAMKMAEEAAGSPKVTTAPTPSAMPACVDGCPTDNPVEAQSPSPTVVETPPIPESVPTAPISTAPTTQMAEIPAGATLPNTGTTGIPTPESATTVKTPVGGFDIPTTFEMSPGVLDLSFLDVPATGMGATEPPSPTAVETPPVPASVPTTPVSTQPATVAAETPAMAEVPDTGTIGMGLPSTSGIPSPAEFDIPGNLNLETGVLDLSFLNTTTPSLPQTPLTGQESSTPFTTNPGLATGGVPPVGGK